MKTTDNAVEQDHRQITVRVITDNASVTLAEVSETTETTEIRSVQDALDLVLGHRPAVTGVARCHPTDRFDPVIGKSLAISRALRRVAEQYEARIPESYRDQHPAERRAIQLDQERQHWRDGYEKLTEMLGYPMDGHDPDSNLLRHAQRELSKAGLYDPDSDYDGMLADAVERLIRVFQAQGHSGFSANLTIDLFSRLAQFQTLTPLTSNPDEWMQVDEGMMPKGDPPVWQSRRRPDAFSNDGGRSYYLLDEEPRVLHTSEPGWVKDVRDSNPDATVEYVEYPPDAQS